MADRHPTNQRVIVYADIGQIMPDVRRWASTPHETRGQWTLGQICAHLADSFAGSMEGFDLSNHRIKRFFMRHVMLWVALNRGIPRDYTVDPRLTPSTDADLDQHIRRLDREVDRYLQYGGPLHAHPLFGRLDRPTWDRVHCVHSAHHMRLVVPAIK